MLCSGAGADQGRAVREGQSWSIQIIARRSRAFAVHYALLLREEFGETGAWSPGRLHQVLTHFEPGFIRVEVDETTYPLHIVIRHRCEAAMVAGTLDPADLSDAFNDTMKPPLGIRPRNPSKGCHQDIHWALAEDWGYSCPHTLWARLWPRNWRKPSTRRCPIPTSTLNAAISGYSLAGSGNCPQPGLFRTIFGLAARTGDGPSTRHRSSHAAY